MESSTAQIKKEFEDLSEDNYNLDVEEIKRLTENNSANDFKNNTLHPVNVKSEVKEENENNIITRGNQLDPNDVEGEKFQKFEVLDTEFIKDDCDESNEVQPAETKGITHQIQEDDNGNNKLQCGICLKVYKTKRTFNRHKRAAHRQANGKEKTYSCDHCGNTYKLLHSLKNHMRHHTNELFKCQFCDKAYAYKPHLRVHLRTHTGETPFKCEICGKEFTRNDTLAGHKKTHQSDREMYKCEICGRVFKSKTSLRCHQTDIHSTEKTHQCKLCAEKFKTRFELTKHVDRHKKMEGLNENHHTESNGIVQPEETDRVCEICHVSCSVEKLEEHMSTHDVKPKDVLIKEELEVSHTGTFIYSCETCGKDFSRQSALLLHTCSLIKDKPLMCPVCGRRFSHRSSLNVHLTTHNECPFECTQCDKKFTTEEALTLHIEEHESGNVKNKFQCGICLKFYKTEEIFKKHKEVHQQANDEEQKEQNKPMYSCDQCGNMYKTLVSMKNHMRQHTNEMFRCHICDKVYAYRALNDDFEEEEDSLRVHLRIHTGETPYKCEICGKEFSRRYGLNHHKKTHQRNRETYKCDLCDKIFKSNGSLRAHQTDVHSKEKNYQCKLCGEKFKARYELMKHANWHKKMGECMENHHTESSEASQPAETDGSESVCEICHVNCSAEGLEVHMSTHDVKPFKCECFMVFFSESEYKKHLKHDCEVVKSGLKLVEDVNLQRDIKEELKVGLEDIKRECVS